MEMYSNKLINEKSPYLLQHAHNPVNWYPWGEEAFEAASKENKLIFLSIGYSTCHWCHVMERESFTDKEVADAMNETFISIKVDREERPDIDNIYMTVCQMTVGGGGWPLNVILTPDRRPVFALTYMPKESRRGMMGILELCSNLKELWLNDREGVEKRANEIMVNLERNARTHRSGQIGNDVFQNAFQGFLDSFDDANGGFGTSPKFPTPHNLIYLTRYYRRTGEERSLQMVTKTLKKMRNGGIFDQIGFGFHRYSTDAAWVVPHFEKMIYDQALLMIAYVEAYQATRKDFYRKVAWEIFDFVRRELTDPEGGFYSALDADSEGMEGKFYTWTAAEIRSVLGQDSYEIFSDYYNVIETGNFIEESTGRRTGRNLLTVNYDMKQFAKDRNIREKDLEEILEDSRRKLLAFRGRRIRPHLDDKVLADMNGLMIAALSYAGRTLKNKEMVEAAKKSAQFILHNMLSENGTLYHRYREGNVAIDGFLDDYSFMIYGLLELYESTFDSEYAKRALELQDSLLRKFSDEENGGFYMSASDRKDLVIRTKQAHDGAIPSGNSIEMMNLVKFYLLKSEPAYEDLAYRTINAFGKEIENSPTNYSFSLIAADILMNKAYSIVVIGNREDEKTIRMIDTVMGCYLPQAVVILKTPGDKIVSEVFENLSSMKPVNNETTAYVCTEKMCLPPFTDPVKMGEALKD
ncbi:thioredoxin domain-containing protein [Oxyplasma meridianum]|uniref:Thioredoxin domain-containing protein n=1 Tax=Oxyplasma meridianum TaxID=3073602 RepID=A0AAX4NGC7_9ARCH